MWSSRGFLGAMLSLIMGTIFQQSSVTHAFLPSQGSMSGMSLSRGRTIILSSSVGTRSCSALQMSDNDEDSQSRLRNLGFSDDEIERSRRKPQKAERKVRVDMVDNIDATTLTAIGFAAIAFNFFVLANMGDGGIGAVVATIINSF